MLKKITKWETEDGTVFDTQEEAEDYMFEQDKEVMVQTTEQERVDFPSPALLTKLQTSTEGGAILVDDYAGGYELLTEIWRVIVADEVSLVPQGWKLVPEEASNDMVNAGEDAFCGTYDYAMIPDVYAAMLAAAPQPPEATVDHSLTVEASPVQLPEPIGEVLHAPECVDGSLSWYTDSPPPAGTKLYTEQQVMDLLKCGGISVKTSK